MSFYPQPGNPPIGLSFPLSWYIEGGPQPPVTVSFPLSWYIEDSWVSLVREIAWEVKMPEPASVVISPLRPEDWAGDAERVVEIVLPFPYDSGRLTVFLRTVSGRWSIFNWETPCVPGQTSYTIGGDVTAAWTTVLDVTSFLDVLVYWSPMGSPFASDRFLDWTLDAVGLVALVSQPQEEAPPRWHAGVLIEQPQEEAPPRWHE